MKKFMPESEMIDGQGYRIQSRNLVVGIWRASTRGFIGIREKFGSEYLFEEYHHETGSPFGTAVALHEIDFTYPTRADGEQVADRLDQDKALFEGLKPFSDAVNEERRREFEEHIRTADLKKFSPITKEEHEKNLRVEKVREWRTGEAARIKALLDEGKTEEARAEDKKLNSEYMARLRKAFKGD